MWPGAHVARELKRFRPHAIHIATEGPLGLAVRRYCRARGVPFTTSYHTRYPEYLRARWPIPLRATYAWLRRFHAAATRTFVSSASLRGQLDGARLQPDLHLWRRGVDLTRFRPARHEHPQLAGLPRPILTCVGRLAVEKNLGGLSAPAAAGYQGGDRRRPAAWRCWRRATRRHASSATASGEELARLLGTADVLVFPSRTDTFGLAMIEALACGVPVAAFPVPGPLDVIEPGVTGVLHEDLATAIGGALRLSRQGCAARAGLSAGRRRRAQFLAGLAPIPTALRATLAVSRSSAMIARRAARRQPSRAGDAN